MKTASPKTRLERELRRLFRSMDFVSRHPALEKGGREAERFAEIYQQLGLAWEYLALQCRHWDGFRKNRTGKAVCGICGQLEDAAESAVLLPVAGKKRLGHRSVPTTEMTLASKKAAMVLDDAITFHGTKLRVIVQNAYRTRLLKKMEGTIAADRMVRIEEGGIECRLDSHLVELRLVSRKRRAEPPRGAFPWELSRAALKRFPLLLETDEKGEFVGVTIFKPRPAKAARGSS